MINYVEDSEILYRRVPCTPENFEKEQSGILRVSPSAFRDRNKQPSVDRAKLCNEDPSFTQGNDAKSGVVFLIASEVRAAGLQKEGDNPIAYTIDIVYAPIPENLAHAEIRTDPAIDSDGVFRRLRLSLAILANRHEWLIIPDESR